MAASIPAALREIILANAELVAWLASYLGSPGIFTADLAPPDARMPFCAIGPAVTDAGETLLDGSEGPRDVVRDVKLYCEAKGETDEIDRMAEILRGVLHSRVLAVDGFRSARTRIVNGPIGVSADTDSYGRLVSVRVHLTR